MHLFFLKILGILCMLPSIVAAMENFAPRIDPVYVVGCSIFSSSGKLLKKYYGWSCAFFPNGNMLVVDGFTAKFFNAKMTLVWRKEMHVHGSVSYFPEDQTASMISSHVTKENIRMDTIRIIDQYGNETKNFSFREKDSSHRHSFAYDNFVLPGVKQEGSQVVSVYRVPKNRSSEPYLAEGNYLVAEILSGNVLLFDSSLQKILFTFSLRNLGYSDFSDVQVTAGGTILFYATSNKRKKDPHSSLVEISVPEGKELWTHGGKPRKSFSSSYEGNLQRLENGNTLFSKIIHSESGNHDGNGDLRGQHWLVEINHAGKILWSRQTPQKHLSGMPNVGKKIDLSSYRASKGDW